MLIKRLKKILIKRLSHCKAPSAIGETITIGLNNKSRNFDNNQEVTQHF